MDAPDPLVSVCMAVLNGGDLVIRAVESALEQDHPRVEVVVVDDASTDDTRARLTARFGPAIEVWSNPSRSGQGRSVNAAIARSRGDLIKFLDHDDMLDRTCVSQLARALQEQPSAGLAFCRRRLEIVGDADEGAQWHDAFASLHRGFERLERFNDGGELLRQLVAGELRSNWIGEPASVMVRRAAIAKVGGFSTRTRHFTDFDLWIRVLSQYDAAFVDEELATYRREAGSLTARNRASGQAWLDRLWMIEALMSVPGVATRYPDLARIRREQRRVAARTVASVVLGRTARAPLTRWLEYVTFRLTHRMTGAQTVGRPLTDHG